MARSNPERSQATRLALMDAAKDLFIKKGFADTATPDIVRAAGVTRGALYHHFEDKKALLTAIVEREAEAVAQQIADMSVRAKSPSEALLRGAAAYFDAMNTPGRTRLLLLEAPAILGAAATGAIDRGNAGSTLETGLIELLGPDANRDWIAATTNMLSAAFDCAALAIAGGADRSVYERSIAVLIDGLAGQNWQYRSKRE
ncbi:TetR family transcriptional regulator [Devosia algicola]|uniref:TetR family transcriptional regulator n=1 Tax=Devosia algicola TaxID=3026418 RepID=A0ABY7YSW0_9HYPH|nr:TetR family transcriptional regulator [Devosia algicola]WDR04391.1 TetR family transcriptional regulator [Devosia algicola]